MGRCDRRPCHDAAGARRQAALAQRPDSTPRHAPQVQGSRNEDRMRIACKSSAQETRNPGVARQGRTLALARVGRVVHVVEQLHEVPAQRGQHVRRVERGQAADHAHRQRAHRHRLVVQRHEQRAQTARARVRACSAARAHAGCLPLAALVEESSRCPGANAGCPEHPSCTAGDVTCMSLSKRTRWQARVP